LVEWQHEPEFDSAGWWQKSTRQARCKKCVQWQCEVVKEINKDFHKMQLGRGGQYSACKGGSRTINQTQQKPLIDMIFTNADHRYVDRLYDKQDGDTIVTMARERVEEAMAYNAELADESTWLWLTSVQMGFSLRPTGGGEHQEREQQEKI